MKSQALAPQTGRIIEAISRLECIKPFVLIGGTALSIQLKTRQECTAEPHSMVNSKHIMRFNYIFNI